MERKHKKIIIAIVILIVLGVAGVLLYKYLNKPEPEPPVIEEPEEIVIEVEEEPEKLIIPIDINYWRTINEHIYAWVTIEDTNISYPILQHPTDNAYYLDHTMYGASGLPGSIYTENRNAKDFTDFNTLIYGHNMKDGSMFKHLHKFREEEFFETHDTVMIYTENAILKYKVFAAVIYNNDHILAKYDNDSVPHRQAFIQSLYDINSSKIIRDGMTIDENSRLITMSTCTGDSNTRLIIVADLVEELKGE